MKEKMLDRNTYYTFDLFEEYLFALLIEEGTILDENDEDDSEDAPFDDALTIEDASWEDFFDEDDLNEEDDLSFS